MTGIHWRTTERGYLVGEFRDALDAPCSSASWGPEGVALGYVDDDVSMGLSRDQARLLGSLLTAFADTGGLREAVDLVAFGFKKGAE